MLFARILLLGGFLVAACAFVPPRNLRLEEARRAYDEAAADAAVSRSAARELAEAAALIERARITLDTLGDIAEVDHLAYLAKQHVAIARETARLAAPAPR